VPPQTPRFYTPRECARSVPTSLHQRAPTWLCQSRKPLRTRS
jgi:hypothetical protein